MPCCSETRWEKEQVFCLGGGGGERGVRLPRSAVGLDLEGGVGVCQVEEEGRTLLVPGTVCAKAGDVRF